MDPERWARLEALFHAASALPLEDVDAWLETECADDTDLKRRVRDLIAANTASEAVVDRDIVDVASPLLGAGALQPDEHLPAGALIGPYRLLELLGTGGMGAVYRAERADGAYTREVALKVVRAGRVQRQAYARFLQEREILARLSHPGIATLLDGGVTDEGKPWLAMELVEGESITRWAASHGLDVRTRLQLVLQVAEAVEYAHRNLIVHRDLKPSNILVSGSGTVKLLDFGIARLVDTGDVEELHTRTGLMLLTPAYAAPEQIRGEAVTTAVDVYAIGAILYELLAGRRPFGDVGSSWAELQRVLDTPPTPPSQADHLDRVVRRSLGGDLDTIALKALHKDPLRRYRSAAELSEDVRRYLDGRPVLARPDSARYRISKFVRRNLAASVASVALLLAVGLGAAGTLWQARVATLETARKEAVADFMVGVFEGADPDLTPGQAVTALELLESGLVRVDSLDAEPEVRVDLLVVLGELFDKLGHYDRAGAVLSQAVAEAGASLSDRDPANAAALDALGRLSTTVGDAREAEELFRSALEAHERSGSSPDAIAATRSNLALALRQLGEYEEAGTIYRDVIARTLESTAGDSLAVTSELNGLGQVLQGQERDAEAAEHFRTVRRLKESAGQRDAQLAHVIHNLGVVLAVLEQNDDASVAHEQALAIWQDLFPDGHPEIARSLEAIGRVHEREGRWQAADSVYGAAIEAWSTLYGSDHSQIAAIRVNRANLHYYQGDFDAAAEAYRQGVRIWRSTGEQNLLGAALRNLAIIDRERGDNASADTLLAEALVIRRELLGDESTGVAEVLSAVAGLRVRQGRFAEAESEARAAIEIYERSLEPGHRLLLHVGVELGQALAEQGRYAEAEPLLAGIHDIFLETLNEADAQLGRAALWLGVSRARLGDVEGGRQLIADALPVLEAGLGVDAPDSRRARSELSRLGG